MALNRKESGHEKAVKLLARVYAEKAAYFRENHERIKALMMSEPESEKRAFLEQEDMQNWEIYLKMFVQREEYEICSLIHLVITEYERLGVTPQKRLPENK